MRRCAGLIIAAAVVVTFPIGAAFAASKTPVAPKASGATLGSILSPLTEGECTGLSGTVDTITADKCASLKRCTTVDKDGVIRYACISVAK
jgi:hypothetical protein